MNAALENFTFRLSTKDDIPNIITFLRTWWSDKHIMANDKEYFMFEFAPLEEPTFTLAIDNATGEIAGLLGFIRSSYGTEGTDVFGSIWRVKEGVDASIGAQLDIKMRELSKCRYRVGIGLNPKTAVPVVRLIFREKCDSMKQYYMLNDAFNDFNIAQINDRISQEHIFLDRKVGFIPVNTIEEAKKYISFEDRGQIPYKDEWYINRHYFNNIRRDYKAIIIRYTDDNDLSQNERNAMIIIRECQAFDSKVLRLIDYFGNHDIMRYCYDAFQQLLSENQYEYIDFYEFGFEDDILSDAGFVLRKKKNDCNIIPNYFEPFEQKNVDIWVRYTDDSTQLYKGDGDQDRANTWDSSIETFDY